MKYNSPNFQWKSIAINPLRAEYLVAAADDPIIRMFDRRMLSLLSTSTPPASLPCDTFMPLQLSLSPQRHRRFLNFMNMDRLNPSYVTSVWDIIMCFQNHIHL